MAGYSPRMIRDATVKIAVGSAAAADFACRVRRAELVPEAGDETRYRTLCPDGTFVEIGSSTWTLVLTGPQDWATAGLSRLLFEHEGEELTVTVDQYGNSHTPTDAEPAFTVKCRAVPGPYGGTVDEMAEYEIELPVTGKPSIVTAATP
jgi:hypothetical protein